MTKAERIMFLINLIRSGDAGSIDELSEKCDVSPRTIYRDLESLQKMNIPVYFDAGYHIKEEADLSFLDVDAGDAELIIFCLRNNPLANHTYFKNRLANLQERLDRRIPGGGQGRLDRLFLTDQESKPTPQISRHGQEMLDRFIQAILEQRVVALAAGDQVSDGVYIPLAVRIAGPEARLIVTTSMDGTPVEVPVESVKRLTLTQSTFERRPIELIPSDRQSA
jgi:predicted DNA-binding transcriptional regulator YafY